MAAHSRLLKLIAVAVAIAVLRLTLDGVKQHGRLNDIHLGRLDGDECRWSRVHGCASLGWLSLSLDD